MSPSVNEWKWSPYPGPQSVALSRLEKEILFGGSRGGGKSELGIIWMAIPAIAKDGNGRWKHPYYRGLTVRRHADDLSSWVDRANQIYARMGAKMTGRPPYWRFPSGAVIRTGHLRDSEAYTKYQGHEYERMLIEELQLIPTEDLYEKLISSARSKRPELPAQIFSTANPGSVGHQWVRSRFVKVFGQDGKLIVPGTPFKDPKNGHWRIYIPATIDSNPALFENDPGYVAYLEGLPHALKMAWRYGDWDSFVGQFLPEFRPNGPMAGDPLWANHVITPDMVDLKPWYHRFGSGDWGYDHPSAFHWYAQEPNGTVHVTRELYVRQLGPVELGVRIAKESAADLSVQPHLTIALDPSAWRRVDDGKTIAQRIAQGIDEALGKGTAFLLGAGDQPLNPNQTMQTGRPIIVLRQADNNKAAGWSTVREYLRFNHLFPSEHLEEALPKLQIHTTCPRLIDGLSVLVFSETKFEEPEEMDAVNGEGGDDAAQSLRYGLQSFQERQIVTPLGTFVAERLQALNRKYQGKADPTIAYMVAQHAEATYRKQFKQIAAPANHTRMSRLRGRFKFWSK
jgi:hypothetical protein